jgi:hypothetical protein
MNNKKDIPFALEATLKEGEPIVPIIVKAVADALVEKARKQGTQKAAEIGQLIAQKGKKLAANLESLNEKLKTIKSD